MLLRLLIMITLVIYHHSLVSVLVVKARRSRIELLLVIALKVIVACEDRATSRCWRLVQQDWLSWLSDIGPGLPYIDVLWLDLSELLWALNSVLGVVSCLWLLYFLIALPRCGRISFLFPDFSPILSRKCILLLQHLVVSLLILLTRRD